MEQSETIGKLSEALSKVQAVLEGAKLDSTNPFFKSKYADLTSVWAACRQPLADNFLSVIQTCASDVPDIVVVETMLAHSSGEWVRGRVAMKPVKADPQGIGSCITYARRYSLAAIVGVAPEDDDGNAASHKSTKQTNTEADVPDHLGAPPPPPPPVANLSTVTRYVKEVTSKKGSSTKVDKEGNKKEAPWTLFTILDDEGGKYSTFKTDVADLATSAQLSNSLVKLTYQAKEKGNNLISLEVE